MPVDGKMVFCNMLGKTLLVSPSKKFINSHQHEANAKAWCSCRYNKLSQNRTALSRLQVIIPSCSGKINALKMLHSYITIKNVPDMGVVLIPFN